MWPLLLLLNSHRICMCLNAMCLSLGLTIPAILGVTSNSPSFLMERPSQRGDQVCMALDRELLSTPSCPALLGG